MQQESGKFPLLEEILTSRGLPLRGTYSNRDLAAMFGVSIRSIQARIATGQLRPRDLPGRARFLSSDLEEYLSNSRRSHCTPAPGDTRSVRQLPAGRNMPETPHSANFDNSPLKRRTATSRTQDGMAIGRNWSATPRDQEGETCKGY